MVGRARFQPSCVRQTIWAEGHWGEGGGESYIYHYIWESQVISTTIYLYRVSLGFWWKGQISAVSLQTPAGWAGVCKSIFPTIVRSGGSCGGGVLSGWLEISQYISRTLRVVYIVMGEFYIMNCKWLPWGGGGGPLKKVGGGLGWCLFNTQFLLPI